MIRVIGGKEYLHISTLTEKSAELKPDQFLVAVWFDGAPDFFIADGEKGIEQAAQYSRDMFGVPPGDNEASGRLHGFNVTVFEKRKS
jgi:hypothetical protein